MSNVKCVDDTDPLPLIRFIANDILFCISDYINKFCFVLYCIVIRPPRGMLVPVYFGVVNSTTTSLLFLKVATELRR